MKRPVCENVTPVAAGVARSFLQENWLDLSSKKLGIKGVGCVGTRCCVGGRSRLGAVADPIGKYFPLGLPLRGPELAPGMAESPPASCAKGCSSRRLFSGSEGVIN